MLTGMEFNFDILEMQKWNQMENVLYFFADDSKILVTV